MIGEQLNCININAINISQLLLQFAKIEARASGQILKSQKFYKYLQFKDLKKWNFLKI